MRFNKMSATCNNTLRAQMLQMVDEIGVFEDQMTSEDRLTHLVVSTPFTPLTQTKERTDALQRANAFYCTFEGDNPRQITPVQALMKLNEGFCRGACSALIDRCIDGFPIEKAAQAITQAKTEVFFRQLVPHLTLLDLYKAQFETWGDPEGVARVEAAIQSLTNAETGETIHTVDFTEGIEIDDAGPLQTKCQRFDSLDTYTTTFNALMDRIPPNTTVHGSIMRSDHVMAFEYGPSGLYLFDTFRETERGLYSFPDKAMFTRALRSFSQEGWEDKLRIESFDTLRSSEVTFVVNHLKPLIKIYENICK